MKPPHPTLEPAEDLVPPHADRTEEDRRWTALVGRARAPGLRWTFLVEFACCLIAVATLVAAGRKTGDYLGAYVFAGCFLLVNLPLHLWISRRREAALLTMIQVKAPALYQELKNDKIA